MSNLPVKVEVNVLSSVDPEPCLLMQARKFIQQDAHLQKLFIRSKKEEKSPEWLAEQMGSRLQELIDTEQPFTDVARYLADEYQQIGDGLLLINPSTGKAIARLQDKDFYTPAPVAREGTGKLVERDPTIRPEAHAFIIQWIFEEAREQELSKALATRVHSTDLLKRQGDPRLQIVTRSGRKGLLEDIRDLLPTVFDSFCSGSPKDFLSFFSVTFDRQGGMPNSLMGGRAFARSVISVVDLKTLNLKFDLKRNILSSFGAQLVREIARNIVLQVPQDRAVDSDDLTRADLNGANLWVASPEICDRIREVDSTVYTLPIEGVPTVGFKDFAGTISIDPESFRCEGREIHERWEVYGSVVFTVRLDSTRVIPLNIRGVSAKNGNISVQVS